ncbi:MAG: Gfo/Idh/MocA family protein [Galactobacter sp.]
MATKPLGIAVIGAGMAGKAHAAAYRSAPTVFDSTLPDLNYVSICDAYEPLAEATAKRYGYLRHDTDWRDIAAADDIDVVSVVVANKLHREIVEGLLAAGKHVLCEKPLSDTLEDARSMATAADAAASKGLVARVGLTYRRQPGLAAIRKLVNDGVLGDVYNVSGIYWTDYGCDPQAPIAWRYKGPNGSGALADVGSHLTYLAEFVGGGDFTTVRGATLSTVIKQRPKPLAAVVGRGKQAVSDEFEQVENDDVAAFSGDLSNGATATLQMSRVASGHPNTLTVEVFGSRGSASYDFRTPGLLKLHLPGAEGEPDGFNGFREVVLGPGAPYWAGGLAMDTPGVGMGQNEGFIFQARAFLEEIAGIPEADSLPRNADFADGLRNMELIDAVSRSAADHGQEKEV